MRDQEKVAKQPSPAQTGWWLKIEKIGSILINHPVRSIRGSFAISS